MGISNTYTSVGKTPGKFPMEATSNTLLGGSVQMLFDKIGFVIIPIATSISSWINVIFYAYFIKKRNLYNFDKQFIYKLPRIVLSVVVMGIVLHLLLDFFSGQFNYNESWKFIYLFIIVGVSLFSYFLTSIFSGAFKFKDIKLKL